MVKIMNQENPCCMDWGYGTLHNVFLEMLSYIDGFCETYEIEYSLAYGSVLGAIRHNGFIPWDDDVDIYMTEKGYKKFKEQFLRHGDHDKYYLQQLDMIDGMVEMPKLRMNGTTYIEPLLVERSMHHGIYIDIFILHNAPSRKLQQRIMNFANQYLILKGLSNRKYTRKKAYNTIMSIMRMFPYHFLRKEALKQVYKYSEIESDIFFDTDLRTYSRSFYEKNLIFPTKRIQFENIYVNIPAKHHEYLSQVYGDYCKIPSVSQIKAAQHAHQWSTTEDFHNFLPNITDYSDERGGK